MPMLLNVCSMFLQIGSFFPFFFDSLSQNKGRTAGFRKSPSAEPRAHTNPATAEEKLLRTLTFCLSAGDEDIRRI